VVAKEGGGNMFADPNDKLPPGDRANVRPAPAQQAGTPDGVGRATGPAYEPPLPLGSDAERAPPYPEAAQRAEVEGKVMLRIHITIDGRVDDVKIIKGLGYGCDEIAVKWARERWRFTPAKRYGKPVTETITVPVTFILDR
jgi:TonB family protein